MSILSFAEYRPDVTAFGGAGQYTDDLVNVYPRGDGYGPVARLATATSALSAACRGFFPARKADGSVQIFAGTSTKLYALDNSALTFTDVSSGLGTYAAIATDSQWSFCQFNKYIIATHANVGPRYYSITTSTEFRAISTSTNISANYVTNVNRFVVLSGIASPLGWRIQWSGLNDIFNYTSGVNSSDFQDFADGGLVRGVAGGEFGLIFQERAVRRMSFSPGSPYIFGIDRIANDDGLLFPYSLVSASDRVFYVGPDGFKTILPGGYPTQIGRERVDRTFLNDVDTSAPQLVIGVRDPKATRVGWAYKSKAGISGQYDKILWYDWVLDKWSAVQDVGEFIASGAIPGITLESLDTAYGTNVDTIALNSMDDISTIAQSALAGFNSSHQMGFFTGTNLPATMETGEKGTDDGRTIYVNGARAISDASSFTIAIGKRSTPTSTQGYSTATVPHSATWICPARVSTRYARAKMTVTSATTWTYASGVEPDVIEEGLR